MQKWLHDRPWIWIVVLLSFLVAGGVAVVIIAELNRPVIVKEKRRVAWSETPPETNPCRAALPLERKGRVA